MKVICALFPEGTDPRTFAEICWRYTPYIAVGKHWVFLNVEGCEKIYPAKSLLLRLQIHSERLGLPMRLGLGSSPGMALSSAKFLKIHKSQFPVEALFCYLSPYDFQFDLRLLDSLHRLGLKTIGDLQGMPRTSLLRRFGPQVVTALSYCLFADVRPWPRFFLSETIEEKLQIDFTDRIQSIEPLLFLLTPAMEKISDRLRSRGKSLLSFRVDIEQEKSAVVEKSKYELHFELSHPHTKAKLLVPIIRERLEKEFRARPLITQIENTKVTVVSTAPFAFAQSDFLRTQEEKMAEEFRQLVLRLSERLGSEKLFRAQLHESYVPEQTWLRSAVNTKIATVQFPERPLRLLPQPIPLEKDEQFLISRTRRWQLLVMEGPERVSTSWWNSSIERDYFLVLTKEGEKLWIFFSPKEGRYYLHGLFD